MSSLVEKFLNKQIRTDAANAVEIAHKGWKELVDTDNFKKWQKKQAEEVQMLSLSPNPNDAILLIDLYHDDVNPSKWIH